MLTLPHKGACPHRRLLGPHVSSIDCVNAWAVQRQACAPCISPPCRLLTPLERRAVCVHCCSRSVRAFCTCCLSVEGTWPHADYPLRTRRCEAAARRAGDGHLRELHQGPRHPAQRRAHHRLHRRLVSGGDLRRQRRHSAQGQDLDCRAQAADCGPAVPARHSRALPQVSSTPSPPGACGQC